MNGYVLETSALPFLIFKESSVKRNLRRYARWSWQMLIVLLLYILLLHKGPETSFQATGFVEFFDKDFPFLIMT